MNLTEFSKSMLVSIITAYDNYIQSANDDNSYVDDWRPVCISEFINNDYEFWKSTDEDIKLVHEEENDIIINWAKAHNEGTIIMPSGIRVTLPDNKDFNGSNNGS